MAHDAIATLRQQIQNVSFILVEPNNTGSVSDDLNVHLDAAKNLPQKAIGALPGVVTLDSFASCYHRGDIHGEVFGNKNGVASRMKSILIDHVTVIDCTGSDPLEDMSVLIQDGRIAHVDRTGQFPAPNNAEVIHGTGKFLIPGLWDMHIHWDDDVAMFHEEKYLSLFIANGVTSVRTMSGSDNQRQWRKQIEAGSLIGPHLLIGSVIVDGEKVKIPGSTPAKNAKEAKEFVRDQITAGASFIKVYSRLTADTYQGIVHESKGKLPFVGHVPYAISIREASNAGQKSIEHLTGILIACSTKEEEFKNLIFQAVPSEEKVSRAIAEELLTTYDEGKAKSLFRHLASTRTWQCPTLTVHRGIANLDDPNLRNDPRLKYMPDGTREFWDPQIYPFTKSWTAADFQHARKKFQKFMEILREINLTGGSIIAGTDAPAAFCFLGFGLHDELELLVNAGLSTMQALQTATRNAAEFSEKLDSLGTIEKGKIADLVLLESNPLLDICNTKTISTVIFGKRIFYQKELQDILDSIEKLSSKRSIAVAMLKVFPEQGIDSAIATYNQLKETEFDRYEFGEGELKFLGSYLLRTGDFGPAIKVLQLNATIHPHSSRALEFLGSAHLYIGNRNEAISNYRRSLELDPNNWNTKGKLGILLSE